MPAASCALQCVLDPVGDEDVRRAALLDDRLSRTMGDDEARGVERRLVTPWPDAQVSHAASEDQRPDAPEVVGLEALGLGR